MTIAALWALIDQELPGIPHHPAPRLPRQHFSAKDTSKEQPKMDDQPLMTTAPDPDTDAPATPEELTVDELLDWAAAHSDQDVQDSGERTRAGLVGLRRRWATDRELTALTAEKQALEQRLAELHAREAELVPPVKKKGRRSTPGGVAPAVIRAWAKKQGLECPARGLVPKHVIEAWQQATRSTT